MKTNRILTLVALGLVSFSALAPVQAASSSCAAVFEKPLDSKTRAALIFEAIYRNPRQAEQMTRAFEIIKRETIKARDPRYRAGDIAAVKDPERALDGIQYMGYVPFIGSADGKGTFKNLQAMVPYLMGKLGITNAYMLPFLKSPFGDAGFDVASYREVDAKFGGDKEFESFQVELAKHNGTSMIDIISNHISKEHEWAKKALSSDPAVAKRYRKFFQTVEKLPEITIDQRDEKGNPMLATYRELNEQGQMVSVQRRVIFPMAADKNHPHYVKMTDETGKDVYFYHTFYPFQLDVNWKNPEVMAEFLKITGFWANKGVDVIRLDAIPFLFKNEESDPRTLQVVEAMREFLAQVSPRTMLIVEANQPPPVTYKYFGEKTKIQVEALQADMSTSSRGQLAYNFDLMAYTWASLMSKNKSYFIDSLTRTPEPPAGAVWANFLRVHDELTLEMVPPEVRKIINDELVATGRGLGFRGDLGVAGRTADFLGRNPQRVSMAHALLLAERGMPILYYGDEIMAANNIPYMNKAAAERGGTVDERDANRGPIAKEDFDRAAASGLSTPEGTVFKNVQRLIEVRKQRKSIRRGDLRVLKTNHESVVALSRTLGEERTLVLVNLSNAPARTIVRVEGSPKELFDLLNEKKISFKQRADGIEVTLRPFEYQWLAQ